MPRSARQKPSISTGGGGEQFIVSSSGGIVETLPNAEHGAEVAALILAQRPESKRVVVVGLGALCLCLQLLRLPQIEVVTWLHPDPEFPGALASVLPEEYRGAYKRLNVQAMDPRAFLKGRAQSYEIAVVDLPDVTTLALNRYASREFFALLRDSLVPDGVAAFRVTGAANYLGGELACLGGSAVSTFMESFPQMAIKPGDETWLLGSNREVLSEDPAVLRERLSTISGIEQVYPPGGLLSLYVPERIAFQRARYEESIKELGAPALLNTDHHPKALLFALFVALRQGRLRGVAENLFVIQRSLCCAAWLGFFAALLMRLHYLRSLPSRAVGTGIRPVNPETGWGIGFLVFCAGLTGIGTSILILFSFQAHFGSLSLYIGLFSALFMVGSVAAGQVMERVMRHRPQAAGRALSFLLTVHVALMLAAAAWGYKGGAVGLGAAMFLAGGVTGAYFPLSARRLLESGQDAVNSGGFLETADHLGAALGGLVTGLVLLPFLGINPPSVFFAMLLALSLPLIPGTRSASLPGTGPVEAVLGPLRYVLTAFVGVALLTSANVARLHRVQEERHFEATARSMLGNVAVEEAKAILPDGRAITYFTPAGPGKSGAYAFEASVLAPGVRGYGGAIDLGTAVRADGTLQEVRILRSRETPSYLELVRPWIMQLEGKRFFGTHGAEPVDGVSGATITSNAILDTLRQSVPVFAQGVLHLSGELSAQTPKRGADRAFLWLTGFFVAAVLLRRRPGVWRRRLFLAASVAVLGYGRNLQYSAQHVFSLLSLESFPEPWTASFFLIVLLPILTIGAGNVYCGYVCPFGALQELVGDCRPRGLDTGPSKPVWRYMRWVKYGLLCLLAVLFALTRDFTLFGVDPLVTFWGQGRGGTALYLALAVLALSFFFPRFWCRNLCPAGAFLALFKKVRVFRRLSPSTFPARCDLGVRNTEELDCIHCDRCAHAKE